MRLWRILVAVGEVQSTSDPDTQNSIYGIGLLSCPADTSAVICVTIFKRKYATLAIAKAEEPTEVIWQSSRISVIEVCCQSLSNRFDDGFEDICYTSVFTVVKYLNI